MKGRDRLKIDKTGAYLNGQKVDRCLSVDIKNINPLGNIEVALHVCVDEVDVQYGIMGRIEK